MEDKNYTLKDNIDGYVFGKTKTPLTTFYMVDNRGYTFEINVDKKFNWLQKKMFKWCFGFEVKENK